MKLRNTYSESDQPISESSNLWFTRAYALSTFISQSGYSLWPTSRSSHFVESLLRKRYIDFLLNLILNTPKTLWSIRAKGKVKQGRYGRERVWKGRVRVLVLRSCDLTCLEDLTIVAILSTSELPGWDEEFFCMNNLVFGTWAQVGPRAGLVENVDLEESVTTLLVICRIQSKVRRKYKNFRSWANLAVCKTLTRC